MAHSCTATAADHTPGAKIYERHRPEDTVLFKTLQAHWRTFLAEVESSDDSVSLPAFVVDEVEAFLKCGILAHGFLRVFCDGCSESRLVPFSCKRRNVCGSCMGRRMCDFAAHLVDYVMPKIPVRQWVLTVPHDLRFRMAFAPKVAGLVLRTFVSTVSAWLRKKARAMGVQGTLKTGGVTVIQRFGSAINLNVHFHSAMIDGVYRIPLDRSPVFHPVPAPTDEEVAVIVAAVCRKVTGKLARHGGEMESDSIAAREPLLAALANASVGGRIATGPRRGAKVLRVGGQAVEATIVSKRCALVDGFNLHANVRIAANDRQGLEHLARYLARPPIAADRLTQLDDGRLALRLKRAFSDGTEAIIFTPGELIEKLVVLVARPRTHGITYHGVLAPAAAIRSEIVPQPDQVAGPEVSSGPNERKAPVPGRRPWAELLKRVFLVDALDRPKCHGRMRILSVIMKAEVVERILGNLGLPTEPPRISPPRAPPQGDLFDRGTAGTWADPAAPDDWPPEASTVKILRAGRRLPGARGEACVSAETSLFSPRGRSTGGAAG